MTITEENEVEAPKAKKKRQRKPKAPDAPGAEQIAAMLQAFSTVIASRAGSHWIMTEDECKSIAEPAAKLMASNENLQKLMEHSDALALAAACVVVFTPRVMASAQIANQKKVMKNAIPRGGSIREIPKQNHDQHERKSKYPANAENVVSNDGKFSAEIDLGNI